MSKPSPESVFHAARCLPAGPEREVFLAAVGQKYDFEPTPEQAEEALLFSLSSRE